MFRRNFELVLDFLCFRSVERKRRYRNGLLLNYVSQQNTLISAYEINLEGRRRSREKEIGLTRPIPYSTFSPFWLLCYKVSAITHACLLQNIPPLPSLIRVMNELNSLFVWVCTFRRGASMCQGTSLALVRFSHAHYTRTNSNPLMSTAAAQLPTHPIIRNQRYLSSVELLGIKSWIAFECGFCFLLFTCVSY